jgi:basic amino acid/polyamine antiporter, APA family
MVELRAPRCITNGAKRNIVKQLKRHLGFWGTFCIATGAMISSGLFVLPGAAFAQAGPAVILAYALASMLMIPAMLSTAELTTAMPRSGGSYFFIERSMGALPGTLAGLSGWFSLALKSAFAMVGIGAFARLIWPEAQISEMHIKAVAAGFCVLFTVLNILSVKEAARFQTILVVGLLVALTAFVVMGAGSDKIELNKFEGFTAKGWPNIYATAALVFVSFGGLTHISSISEEIRNPGKVIPQAMIAALTVVTILYVAAIFVTVGVLDADTLAASYTPLSDAARLFMGTPGLVLLSAGAILAFITTGNGGILAASRFPLAMARDGLLPRGLGKVSKHDTPTVGILATGGFMLVMVLLLDIADLVKVASTMLLIKFLLTNLSVLVMRSSKIENYRPQFKSPLYPWMQIFGIAVEIILLWMLIAKLGMLPLITLGAFFGGGTLWYFLYVRRNNNPESSRESALVYMVRNVVAKEIYRSKLESELREIAFHRDSVVQDRFDKLIHDCVILDLPDATTAQAMFAQAAEALSPRLDVAADALDAKFHEREKQSSTVIQPGLAIPHIIIDGEKHFDLLIVRCREGITFTEAPDPVTTAFILVGTKDERNYHLRALMAIANIVQEPEFMDRWLSSQSAEHLRDILLLSGRQRDNA